MKNKEENESPSNFSIKLNARLSSFLKHLNTSTFTLLLFRLFMVKLLDLFTCTGDSLTIFLCIRIIFFCEVGLCLNGCNKALQSINNYQVSPCCSKLFCTLMCGFWSVMWLREVGEQMALVAFIS